MAFVFLCRVIIAVIVSLENHMLEVLAPSFFCVQNQMPERNLQINVASRFFAPTPSMI